MKQPETMLTDALFLCACLCVRVCVCVCVCVSETGAVGGCCCLRLTVRLNEASDLRR